MSAMDSGIGNQGIKKIGVPIGNFGNVGGYGGFGNFTLPEIGAGDTSPPGAVYTPPPGGGSFAPGSQMKGFDLSGGGANSLIDPESGKMTPGLGLPPLPGVGQVPPQPGVAGIPGLPEIGPMGSRGPTIPPFQPYTNVSPDPSRNAPAKPPEFVSPPPAQPPAQPQESVPASFIHPFQGGYTGNIASGSDNPSVGGGISLFGGGSPLPGGVSPFPGEGNPLWDAIGKSALPTGGGGVLGAPIDIAGLRPAGVGMGVGMAAGLPAMGVSPAGMGASGGIDIAGGALGW